ncbi:MAG: hypothetical protein CMO44_15885 [Verrucomicrobiales bacterium]|mgnify:CR=1 FL=1|nr:hypothetical protein [Verrucomicrobiales bacterium]|tara:strand:+ start:730 stop:1779 length:1050 start_codon:yes stop_codon:yes gene_type:complete
MPYVFGGSSGGGKSVLQTISFINSTTWSPAQDMNAKIYVIGAGGSGAASGGVSTGGGAGGCAVTIADLDASTTYTITIGAPGLGVYHGPSHGNAGGNSTFAGSGISTMTGSGGQAGLYDGQGVAKAGGAGGAASGGGYGNFTGGAGGATSGSGASWMSTGGGAVGLWATGTSAPGVVGSTDNPDAGFYHNEGGYTHGVGSGASVGGTFLSKFHSAQGANTSMDLIRQEVGGLLSLAGMGGATGNSAQMYWDYAGTYDSQQIAGTLPMGQGSRPLRNNGNASIVGLQAGAFAGSGALFTTTSSSYWALTGPGGIGGGSGGAVNGANTTNSYTMTGQGGVGCVLIEILEYK